MKFKMLNAAFAGLVLTISGIANAGIIPASEAGYTQVYGLNVGTENLHVNIPYYLDASSSIANSSFTRIAYHMELQIGQGPIEWVWVSMDAFTNDASKIGIPSFAGSDMSFQQLLNNMNVFSNKVGVTTGLGISTGNIEFWPYNYGPANSALVPNALDNLYDSGDLNSLRSSYGSMQIHNNASNETIFALNRFAAGDKDIGIGSRASGHSDWTFASNSGQYAIKTLDVWVSSVPEPSTLAILALGILGLGARRFKK